MAGNLLIFILIHFWLCWSQLIRCSIRVILGSIFFCLFPLQLFHDNEYKMTNMKLAVCTLTPDIINANVLRKYIHVARVAYIFQFSIPHNSKGQRTDTRKEADLDQYTMFFFYVTFLGLIIVYFFGRILLGIVQIELFE